MTERVVHDQTNTFLWKNNVLHNFPSGIRPNNSANLCLERLTDKMLKGSGEDLLTGMIPTDLQETFDIMNHKVLLHKFKAIKF